MLSSLILGTRWVNYIEWAFGELYGEGSTRFRTEIKIMEKELAALYEKCVAQDKRAGNGESSSSSANIPSIPVQAGYESFLSSCSTRISKSELRNYLEDEVEPHNKALDLLGWWKGNAPRHPIMHSQEVPYYPSYLCVFRIYLQHDRKDFRYVNSYY